MSILKSRKKKDQVSERLQDYLVRSHSFQEMGTRQLPDKDYDVLTFPHIIFASGVIMSIYGYFIIYISTGYSAYLDGLIVLIIGNIIATLGIFILLKKYVDSLAILILMGIGIIVLMMAIWDFLLFPWAEAEGFLPADMSSEGDFVTNVFLVILTTLTFAYTACFIWFIAARYASALYYQFFAYTKEKAAKFFIVDPWRKTLKSKTSLIGDILNRVYVPFFFLISIIMAIGSSGQLYFVQIQWNNYFEAVLLLYFLLCAMVVLFPSFWLLDYVRYYNEERLIVRSLGQRVLILIKGYAGIGTIVAFISRSGDDGIVGASLQFYMVAMYLIPSLIILIGGYVLLTERDVYYIAERIVHGNKVIVDYKIIDSTGEELKWWLFLSQKQEKEGGESSNE